MLPVKNEFRKSYQSNRKGKSFNNEFKGKKSGKAYYEYVEECKRKQELIIRQKLEEVQGKSIKNEVKLENTSSNAYVECNTESQGYDNQVETKSELKELPFKSDGSFLEQFKKMQRIVHLDNAANKSFEIPTEVDKGGEQEKINGIIQSISPKKEPKTSIRKHKTSEDECEEVITPEDPKVLIAIENLVSQASVLPQHIQTAYIKQFEDQEEYWFLTLSDSIEYCYFHWRLEQASQDYVKQIEISCKNSCNSNLSSVSSSTGKKRKSRWNSEQPKVVLIPVMPPNAQLLTNSQKQQMQYQKELQAMHEFIMAQQKAKEQEVMNSIAGVDYGPANTKYGKFKFEYDSDEDVKDGTWEHRLRKEEMEATREWADKLTEMGQGKHHIGDFLPPEELDRFMETFRALKEGREPNFTEFTSFKITCENVGFKMLKKMGWKEGDGLGIDGNGIKVPLTNGPVKADNIGIGVSQLSKLSKFDDEYDAYRKRMMLAYRFRPNPLNNPRRDYY